MTFRTPPSHKHLSGYMRVRSRRGNWLAVVLLRGSRRDLFFCLTALLIFCLGSVLYQLNGGAPRILLDVGYYLGKTSNILYALEVVTVDSAVWNGNMKCMPVITCPEFIYLVFSLPLFWTSRCFNKITAKEHKHLFNWTFDLKPHILYIKKKIK